MTHPDSPTPDRPIRLAVLTSVHPPFDARVFHREAVSLTRAGIDVTLFAPGAPSGDFEGVHVRPVSGSGGRAGRPMRWPALLVKAARRRPDVYQIHDPELLPWALLLQTATGRPVIYDSHEFLAESILSKHWIPAPLRRPASRLADLVEKWIAGRLAAVVAVTDDMAERFERVQPRTAVVMNLPPRRQTGGGEAGAGRALRPERPIVIYAGLMNRERGLTILRRTAELVRRDHPDFELHVLGPVEWHGLEAEREAYERGEWAASGVVFDPPVPQPEVATRLAAASLGWLPMNPETPSKLLAWPVKLGEYMAAGLPVVASDLPVQARVIREAGSGVVVPEYTPEAHAAAISALLSDPARAAELGACGRKAAEERYVWETQAARLEALVRELAGRPKEPATA